MEVGIGGCLFIFKQEAAYEFSEGDWSSDVCSSDLVNVGTTENRGFEVSLDGDIFKGGKVEWTSGINYAYGTTKLKKLSDDMYRASYVELYQKPGVGTSEYFFRIQEGGKVGQFYGYEYAGVEDGKMMIYTDEGNAVPVSEADVKYKRYIGNGTPTSFLSWNNTLRYKNFDLNIFFRGEIGRASCRERVSSPV